MKQLETIAVFGKMHNFENRNIKTFYNCTLKEAIPSIITDLLDAKSSVLYAFNEPVQAFQLDPLNILARKKISVEYLARRVLLGPLSDRVNRKII